MNFSGLHDLFQKLFKWNLKRDEAWLNTGEDVQMPLSIGWRILFEMTTSFQNQPKSRAIIGELFARVNACPSKVAKTQFGSDKAGCTTLILAIVGLRRGAGWLCHGSRLNKPLVYFQSHHLLNQTLSKPRHILQGADVI